MICPSTGLGTRFKNGLIAKPFFMGENKITRFFPLNKSNEKYEMQFDSNDGFSLHFRERAKH
jgi:hypothetical protein